VIINNQEIAQSVTFAQPSVEQGDLLRDLLIESKSYWGYSTEKLEYWRSIVTFDASYIRENTVRLILLGLKVIGFFAIKSDEVDELDHLWLLPEAIGKGIGHIAFDEVLQHCKRLGIHNFLITSDPDAEGFYLHTGATHESQVWSGEQSRMLPLLRYTLD
jgi:GNAT superfamily N-acetyltransferase